jgi:superfamily I DNA/RNA helicase/PHP family Zn ribbon phosphoesterase
MRIIADLHIHSHFSRATSAKLTPPWLERWARIKGIDLLGTGDCTHPRWLAELREQLTEAGEGVYTLKEDVRRVFDRGPARVEAPPGPEFAPPPRFVLTGEISTIYKKGDKTRKVHHLVILPDFKAAGAFQTALERRGNISSDGRPILGLDSRELLALLLDTDPRALLIPAHIWTPWFSALGAQGGFDSIEECYGDLASQIPAVETGLSSNPPMNWALSSLDRFSIISNSDAHSPDKLGREATVFDMDLSYPSLRAALGDCRAPEAGAREIAGTGAHGAGSSGAPGVEAGAPGVIETIEFFPQEGKYHYDGHRKCGVYLSPGEAVRAGGLCPVCGKVLTRGVMGRVLELADRPVEETAPCPPVTCPPGPAGNRRPYRSLIPLREILGELLETGAASKKVNAAYTALIEKAGPELFILMDMPLGETKKLRCPGLSGDLVAEALARMRAGEVAISPGYDGEYGVIRAFPPGQGGGGKEKELFEIPAESASPAGPGKAAAGRAPPEKKARPETPSGKAAPEPVKRAGGLSPQPLFPPGGTRGAESPAPAGPRAFVPNGEQAKILAYDGDQALIIAGPGTGKTALLSARIARLIQEGRDPASILALSFTVKAATELRDRINRETGGAARIHTGTFHSLCASLLREQEGNRGVPRNFGILDEGARQTLLQELCGEFPGKRIRAAGLGSYIEAKKRFLLLPGEDRPRPPAFLAALAEELWQVLLPGLPETEAGREELYGRYRDRLRTAGLLDFDDLTAGTVRLLGGSGELLAVYRDRFRFIFVDEYQDINFAQYVLIRLLAPAEGLVPGGGTGKSSLWVIGDPNQAIYGFRGADRRFIDRFLTDYPRAASFALSKSFRCAAPIINAAGHLVEAALEGTASAVKLFRAEYPTEKSEAEGIARRVAGLIGGTSFFALDSNAATGLAGGLAGAGPPQRGVPEDAAGGWRQGGDRATCCLPPPQDRENGGAAEAVSLGDCAVLLRTTALAPPLLKALGDHGIPFDLTGELPWWEDEPVKSLLAFLREALSGTGGDLLRERAGDKPAELIRLAWDYGRQDGPVHKEQAALERLYDLAALFDDLPSLLDTLRTSDPAGLPSPRQEGLRIMSIHASKGLEFDVVFAAALEEGLLPFTLYEGESPDHLEEERRLLYVAMTRARRGLYLSWARSRHYQGRTLKGRPSRFLETLEDLVPPAREERPLKRDPQGRLF